MHIYKTMYDGAAPTRHSASRESLPRQVGYKAVDEGSLRVEVPGPGHWVLTGKGDLKKVGDKAEL